MIFGDALHKNRRNEPWWLEIIRRTISLCLIFLLIMYGIFLLNNLSKYINTLNIITVESKNSVNFPGKKIFLFFTKKKFLKELNNLFIY